MLDTHPKTSLEHSLKCGLKTSLEHSLEYGLERYLERRSSTTVSGKRIFNRVLDAAGMSNLMVTRALPLGLARGAQHGAH